VHSSCAGFPLALNAPITPALFRLKAVFDPFRNDPRFQKLVALPETNNAQPRRLA
jgi:hypothetical protein